MSAPVRVSDAGRLRDGGAGSAAGVRKPPRDETAHKVGGNDAAGAMGISGRGELFGRDGADRSSRATVKRLVIEIGSATE